MDTGKANQRPGKSGGKSGVAHFPRTLAGSATPVRDASREAVLAEYEEAVTLIQQGEFSAAHPALERLLHSAPPEFLDRVRMYLAVCTAQRERADAQFETPEEHYDYAVSLLNDGHYEDAREHLVEIAAKHEGADYAQYGLAVISSITGDPQGCLEKLSEAIRMNAANRIHARSDSDFQDMADDPRFTELLYPDA